MIRPHFIALEKALWIEQPHESTVEDIGGKALGLSSIKAADLPTPAALIVPTDVYRAGLREAGVSKILGKVEARDSTSFLGQVRREIESLELGKIFNMGLAEAARLIPSPYAVRSSAVVEDAYDSSWAGQFLTILNVRSDALPRSIVRCWASTFTSPVASYAATQKIDIRHINMGVIIQQMVSPAWAGVLFTGIDSRRKKNPNSILFEAVRGLGEKLVNGTVRPDLRVEVSLTDFAVRSRASELGAGPQGTGTSMIPDEVMSDLGRGASRLRQIYGQDFLDIEWAWDGTTAWFLQVRTLVSP